MQKPELSEREIQLIEMLRREAHDVKDCFTRFSFQAIAVSGIVLGFIAKFQESTPWLGFSSVFVIIITLVVSRIGNYKYATANRHFGYELYLQRTRWINDYPPPGWQSYMKKIGWEEAMNAWRIVQASIFVKLYNSGAYKANTLKSDFEDAPNKWFCQRDFTTGKAKGDGAASEYHPGDYLKIMLDVLHLITILSFIPIIIIPVQFILCGKYFEAILSMLIAAPIFIISLTHINIRIKRRRILEDGLLSIQSCAITWQAVVVAHFRALDSIAEDGDNYSEYTRKLSSQAENLTQNVLNIHGWIRVPHAAE